MGAHILRTGSESYNIPTTGLQLASSRAVTDTGVIDGITTHGTEVFDPESINTDMC